MINLVLILNLITILVCLPLNVLILVEFIQKFKNIGGNKNVKK